MNSSYFIIDGLVYFKAFDNVYYRYERHVISASAIMVNIPPLNG